MTTSAPSIVTVNGYSASSGDEESIIIENLLTRVIIIIIN
jgi:hypothetical protein